MNCPRCIDAALRPRVESGIEIDECEACHGIWLDMLELERLLEADAQALIRDDRRFARVSADDGRIYCPKCRHTYLIRINSLLRPGTMIDSCSVCFGLWLDAGEFSRLARKGLWDRLRSLFLGKDSRKADAR